MDTLLTNDLLTIGKKQFTSRLMLGTGKYKNFQEAKEAISISGCQILTVAVRRAQSANVEGIDTLLQNLDWSKIWLLPNTAGSQTAEQAIRLAFLGREISKNLNYADNNFLKLEASAQRYSWQGPVVPHVTGVCGATTRQLSGHLLPLRPL